MLVIGQFKSKVQDKVHKKIHILSTTGLQVQKMNSSYFKHLWFNVWLWFAEAASRSEKSGNTNKCRPLVNIIESTVTANLAPLLTPFYSVLCFLISTE